MNMSHVVFVANSKAIESNGKERLQFYIKWLDIISLILSQIGRDEEQVSKQALYRQGRSSQAVETACGKA